MILLKEYKEIYGYSPKCISTYWKGYKEIKFIKTTLNIFVGSYAINSKILNKSIPCLHDFQQWYWSTVIK